MCVRKVEIFTPKYADSSAKIFTSQQNRDIDKHYAFLLVTPDRPQHKRRRQVLKTAVRQVLKTAVRQVLKTAVSMSEDLCLSPRKPRVLFLSLPEMLTSSDGFRAMTSPWIL